MANCYRLLILILMSAMPAVSLASEPPTPTPQPSPESVETARQLRKEVERKARGSTVAVMQLAALVEQGDDGFLPDRGAALDLYEEVARKGERTSQAKMCRAFLLGDGRPKDVTKAAPYCNSLGTADATGLFWAAYDFENGVTGPKDEAQALDLYTMSASLGSGDAALVLGHRALSDNKPEAARAWFRLGANQGSADAMNLLAQLLDEGRGGPIDSAQATWLYSNAAALGNSDAATKMASRTVEPFLVVTKPDEQLELVRTYKTPKGDRTEKLTIGKLVSIFERAYPVTNGGTMSEGAVRFQCFVKEDHQVESCLILHEFPVGFGFGKQVQAAFSHLTFPEKDLEGKASGGRAFTMTFRWRLS